MKKSFVIVFSLLFIGLLSTGLITIPDVNAVSYYNWIKGYDMETATNYIEDCGFESNAFNSGVLYGNWSSPDAVTFESNPHSGVYNILLDNIESLWYNFSEPILGADISDFTFWYCGIGQDQFDLTLYYSDSTSDVINDYDTGEPATWNYITEMYDEIDESKYLVAFKFYNDVTSDFRLDDFYLGVEDEYSQEQYDYDTYPWRTTGITRYWQQIGYIDFGMLTYIPFFPFETMPIGAYIDLDMIGHNLIWGRNSNGSGYIGFDEWNGQFVQDIEYLDSDSVHYIDLWVYTAYTGDVGIKINIIYSDRTYDTKTVNITQVSTWEHLNFGGSWIDSNKYIIQIQISLSNYIGAYVNIDDIGLWSSLTANSHRFTFTVSPSPIRQSFIGFDAYQSQTYVFTGYLWDVNNELSENGTVTISHNYGLTTATLSNGIFAFTINPRTGTSDFTEQIGISVNNGDTIEYYELTVNWIYVSGGGGGGDDEERSNNMMDWIIMFCVVFVPAILFAGGIYENNQQPDALHISPIFGLIAGLVLSIGIGVYTGLVPLWLLILMVVAIGFLIAGMFNKK